MMGSRVLGVPGSRGQEVVGSRGWWGSRNGEDPVGGFDIGGGGGLGGGV